MFISEYFQEFKLLQAYNVFLFRYVNGHAKKHFEETQLVGVCQKKCEKQEKEKYHHSVCMDCSTYSVFW